MIKNWWDDEVFAPLGSDTYTLDSNWATYALGKWALRNQKTLLNGCVAGPLKGKIEKLFSFIETLGAHKAVFAPPNKDDKSIKVTYVWPDGAITIDYDSDGNFVSNYSTTDAELFHKLETELFKHLGVQKSHGKVYVLCATEMGIRLNSIGVAAVPFIEENYYSEVVDNFRHLVSDLERPDPCGRLAILDGPPGCGKCLGIGTPVLMYDGRTTPVEDIRVGDLLMGPDSKPRRVLSTVRDKGELYRITPVRGEPWVCNDVHVLTLVNSYTDEVIDVPLNEYLSKSSGWKHNYKQFSPDGGVNFGVSPQLEVNPYFFGLWLGDGTKFEGNCGLVTVTITKPDPEIEMTVRKIAKEWGLEYRRRRYTDRCDGHAIVGIRGQGNPLLDTMRKLWCNNRIPHKYLTSSREDRMQLLAGLIDSDGYLNNGGFEIVQKNKALAQDIVFLARSLGFKVVSSIKTVNGNDYTRLYISGDCSLIPTNVPRKKARPRQQIKNTLRTGFNVEAIGYGEYAGFTLDGDGRFLLGDFTVTHNTFLVRSLLNECPNALFVIVPSEMVSELGSPNLIPTIIDTKRHRAGSQSGPIVFIIEDADECLAPRGADNMRSISSTLNLSDGILGAMIDIRIICTTNAKVEEMDEAIMRPGRLCRRIEIGLLDIEQCAKIYKRISGQDMPALDSEVKFMTLAEVYRAAKTGGFKDRKTRRRAGFKTGDGN